MVGKDLVSAIVQILVSGIQGIATGVGQGLSTLAKGIFFETVGEAGSQTTQLSVLGTCIVAFAAISLGLALCRWVLNFFTSLGQRNR